MFSLEYILVAQRQKCELVCSTNLSKLLKKNFLFNRILRFILVAASFGLSHGVTLRCIYDDVAWALIGTRYSCNAFIIDLGNLTTIYAVEGTHLEGRSHADVEVINISNFQVINHIPFGFDHFFPNLILVDWFRGNLTTVSADRLEQFPNMIMLNLEHNSLVSLDGDLFKNSGKLQWLAISDNLLLHAGHGLLDDLHDLETAHFEGNPCINFFAGTPERIQELRTQLAIRCPPLDETTTEVTTTEIEECSAGCEIQIESLENAVFEESRGLRNEIEQLQEDNARHEERISQQDEVIADYETRIAELERQIREILTSPCLQC